MGPVVTGAPYSATEVTEHTQTLADGTHITQKPRTTLMFRDSQGRTRTERPMFGGPYGGDGGPTMIQIQDPVAGFQYTLDQQDHVAHRVALTRRRRRWRGDRSCRRDGVRNVISDSAASTSGARKNSAKRRCFRWKRRAGKPDRAVR